MLLAGRQTASLRQDENLEVSSKLDLADYRHLLLTFSSDPTYPNISMIKPTS